MVVIQHVNNYLCHSGTKRKPCPSLSTLLFVLVVAAVVSLATAAPTVAATALHGSMEVNATSFFWQLVLDTASANGNTADLETAFTADFTQALTDAGITTATVTASFDSNPVTPASFYVNYTVTPADASATVDAAAVSAAFMASALTQVNNYVDVMKASLTAYEDLVPTTPVHGWNAPDLTVFYEEVEENKAGLTTVVDVVATNSSDAIFYFTGNYSGWNLAVQNFEEPMKNELITTAESVLSRHNYNYTVTITNMVHQESPDGKGTGPSLKFYVTVVQGMGSEATEAWNASMIVSMLASDKYTNVLSYYNYDGSSRLRRQEGRPRAAIPTAAEGTAGATVYVGPNVGNMQWKCTSGCIGMVIMSAVLVFLMLVTLIVVVSVVCCCYKDKDGHGQYRRASSMDVPPYPDRHSLSQAPQVGGTGPLGRREDSDASAASMNPLITDTGRKYGQQDSILKPQSARKGDIMVAPAIVSPSSTSDGQHYYGGQPSREMTTYSQASVVEGVPAQDAPLPNKHVWEGR